MNMEGHCSSICTAHFVSSENVLRRSIDIDFGLAVSAVQKECHMKYDHGIAMAVSSQIIDLALEAQHKFAQF